MPFAAEAGTAGSRRAAVFDLHMADIAAPGNVRRAIVDRVAEAILAEAEAFGADLIVLGSPRRGKWPPACSAA